MGDSTVILPDGTVLTRVIVRRRGNPDRDEAHWFIGEKEIPVARAHKMLAGAYGADRLVYLIARGL